MIEQDQMDQFQASLLQELEHATPEGVDISIQASVIMLRILLAKRLEQVKQQEPNIEDLSVNVYAQAASEPFYWAYPTDPNILSGNGDNLSEAMEMCKLHIINRTSASDDLKGRLGF